MCSRFVAVLCLFLGLVFAFPSPDLALRQVASPTVETANIGPSQMTTSSSTASPSAAAAFVMPGTTIQVLPIGLGIYGGITAVAVFVVAFVTWERVQYRKTFRQQRRAESNWNAYGGATKGDFSN